MTAAREQLGWAHDAFSVPSAHYEAWDARAKGFVHCAYFKKDLGRRFFSICNCCSCCCQGMN